MPRVAANGIELEYESFGEGEPLLLIMGLGAQLLLWDAEFCAELASHGFRVIRFDNRDTGLSTHLHHLRPPDPRLSLARALVGRPVRAPYTLSDMAADVVGLMDALDLPRAHLMGMSMGGMIAQTAAIEHPDRVRSLISYASGPGDVFPLPRPRALRTLLSPPPRSRADAIANGLAFQRACGSTAFAWSESGSAELWGACYDRSSDPPGFARQLGAVLASGSRTPLLGRVRCPALVIHGLADPLILPAAARRMARALPDARLELIDGLGHDLPLGAWTRIIDLVTDHARRAARPAAN